MRLSYEDQKRKDAIDDAVEALLYRRHRARAELAGSRQCRFSEPSSEERPALVLKLCKQWEEVPARLDAKIAAARNGATPSSPAKPTSRRDGPLTATVAARLGLSRQPVQKSTVGLHE